MGFDTIHETVIRDIIDLIKDGSDATQDVANLNSYRGAGYASSITKATKGLVMEFPVLVSKANHIESAGIVAKAYEAKFVTLLHMAFVASNITNNAEGIEYIKNFHTNLDSNKLTVDDFMNVMDAFVDESSNITADSYAKYKAVTADMRNLCYCFGDDIKESSLNSYKVMNNYGSLKVIQERKGDDPIDYAEKIISMRNKAIQSDNDTIRTSNDGIRTDNDIKRTNSQLYRNNLQNQMDKNRDRREEEKNFRDAKKVDSDIRKNNLDMLNTSQNLITNYIVPSDLKKANELTPTMMVVNFVYKENETSEAVYQQLIVGVKAKLYEVEPMDVINKLITKHADSNLLLKLVKVNTRQISFVKDFLFAIDDAKLYALSKSRKGSTNKLFKVLERRALGSRASRTLGMKDYCKAITSLVISQEEAEELLKNNIDVSNPKVIRSIMEQLNLISFAIIDESSESVKFIFDTGDDIYETIPLSKLEKEQKDGMSKKVINLLAKMNR